jgi:hypothetical protein
MEDYMPPIEKRRSCLGYYIGLEEAPLGNASGCHILG